MKEEFAMPNDQQVDRTALWERIKLALADECWAFRTVEGIADEIGVNPDVVTEQLDLHDSEVRTSIDWRTRPRRILYTTRSRRMSFRELAADAQEFARRW